ncbi:HugZ family protein [Alkalimarinus sediminis]|uniref:Pyridoxamine 5'-phosphate oxidase family protein n=1 Tax=Alkalimarinus sediminis TaxID=1632866 RepID=A0A9E8KQS3_9ALTE|nr:pyridoxamine 5'-phosphate oxidase family protein [Alkalimarinus sediminis]UZW75485.1 pyridoxamine 5'-phosphate oxidase family protein [Alkalimarinus sediminis]
MNNSEHTQPAEFNSTEIMQEIEDLITQFKTVQMATLNSLGNPEASYTPYIRSDGEYFIFISSLASHTENICQHPTLSLFFVQDEGQTKNLFARKRLTIECTAEMIKRDGTEWTEILDLFQEEHGATVGLLRTLPDFKLFKLSPVSATFIKGFGQAFKLEGDEFNSISQLTGK